MSWFGFGGGDKEKEAKSSSSSYDNDFSGASDHHSEFSSPGTSANSGSFEQQLAMEQQKMMLQTLVLKVSELSFQQCVTKPTSSLSSSESACINAVSKKYIDTAEFVLDRLTRGSQ